MWNKTRITELLEIEYPIIQGPFGGRFSSVKLVSAVSNQGGLGSFGLNAYGYYEILEVGRQIRQATSRPFNLNLWVPLEDEHLHDYTQPDFDHLVELFKPYFKELNVALPEKPNKQTQDFDQQVRAILEVKPPVVSFIFGMPSSDIVDELKRRCINILAVATTVDEAVYLESTGADIVIASGAEAGGHRASFLRRAEESLTGTKDLMRELQGRIKLPVVAAGGISTGKDIREILDLGAEGVQIGTAFLATEESNAPASHRSKLMADPPLETRLTRLFSGRLARGIDNQLMRDFPDASGLAPYPVQRHFIGPLLAAAMEQEKWEWAAFWSGKLSGTLKYRSAEALFDSLVRDLEKRH